MIIGGLQKTTLIDYPGRIAATVFLSGCSFRCPWCYSSELVLPEKIKQQPKISEKKLFEFLKSRRGMLEGVVLCGGEPTINKELGKFIKKIKDLGFFIKLDTNGFHPEMLEKLISQELLDYIAMDIKAPFRIQQAKGKNQNENLKFKTKYELAAGVKVDLEAIKKSVELIKNSGIDYEFRSTIVPGVHSKEDIIQIAEDIGPAKRYYLQNFRPEKTIDPGFEKIKPYPDDFLQGIIKEIAPFFKICQLRK